MKTLSDIERQIKELQEQALQIEKQEAEIKNNLILSKFSELLIAPTFDESKISDCEYLEEWFRKTLVLEGQSEANTWFNPSKMEEAKKIYKDYAPKNPQFRVNKYLEYEILYSPADYQHYLFQPISWLERCGENLKSPVSSNGFFFKLIEEKELNTSRSTETELIIALCNTNTDKDIYAYLRVHASGDRYEEFHDFLSDAMDSVCVVEPKRVTTTKYVEKK